MSRENYDMAAEEALGNTFGQVLGVLIALGGVV